MQGRVLLVRMDENFFAQRLAFIGYEIAQDSEVVMAGLPVWMVR
jgi:hypothetical protein